MFCTFLRYNRNQEQRQEMLGQLIRGQNLQLMLLGLSF